MLGDSRFDVSTRPAALDESSRVPREGRLGRRQGPYRCHERSLPQGCSTLVGKGLCGEWLTPRGGPRHPAVVGVNWNDQPSALGCRGRARLEITRAVPSTTLTTTCAVCNDGGADGALCRPLHSLAPPRKQWGREQPPRFPPCATPRGSREGCSRPGVSVPIARGILQRSARRLRVGCHVRTRCRSRVNRAALSTHILRRYSRCFGSSAHRFRIDRASVTDVS